MPSRPLNESHVLGITSVETGSVIKAVKINDRVARELAVLAIAVIAPYTALVIFVTEVMGWWAIAVAIGLVAGSAAWYRQDKLVATRFRLFLQAATEKERIP